MAAFDADGDRPDDDAAARYAVALRGHAVRDRIWLAVDDGHLHVTALWMDLARRLPHPYDAAPLFLAAWPAPSRCFGVPPTPPSVWASPCSR